MTIKQKLKIFNVKAFQNKVKFDMRLWNAKKPFVEVQNTMKQEKKELHGKAPHVSWSKFLLLFLFINFTILELFIGWVTVKCIALAFIMGTAIDFTPLVTLVGAVMGQTISYGIYAAKSKAENTKNGLVYEQAKWEFEANNTPTYNNEEGDG